MKQKTIAEIIEFWDRRRAAEGRRSISRGSGYYRILAFGRRIGEEYLTQKLVDKWFEQRPTENALSFYERLADSKKLLLYAVTEGYAPNIRIPRMPPKPRKKNNKKVPYLPSDEELDNFFRATTELPRSHTGVLKAQFNMEIPVIFRMMESAGLRPLEVRYLRRRDVNLESGLVHVVETKGYHLHNVVLHESMLSLARIYDENMDRLLPNRTYFFPGKNDVPFSPELLRKFFNKCWLKYNTKPKGVIGLNCYMLRHDYATRNINSWTLKDQENNLKKLLTLSRSMGHGNLKSTMYYFRLSPIMAKVMDRLVVDAYNEVIPEVPDWEKGNADEDNTNP